MRRCSYASAHSQPLPLRNSFAQGHFELPLIQPSLTNQPASQTISSSEGMSKPSDGSWLVMAFDVVPEADRGGAQLSALRGSLAHHGPRAAAAGPVAARAARSSRRRVRLRHSDLALRKGLHVFEPLVGRRVQRLPLNCHRDPEHRGQTIGLRNGRGWQSFVR